MESRDILSRLNTSVCLKERLAAIFFGGCSYSSVKGDSPFRWAFLAMLTQALPDLRSLPAVRPRTEPCPS